MLILKDKRQMIVCLHLKTLHLQVLKILNIIYLIIIEVLHNYRLMVFKLVIKIFNIRLFKNKNLIAITCLVIILDNKMEGHLVFKKQQPPMKAIKMI